MLALSGLAVFVAAALALLLVPGPAVLYIVARSVDHGRRAGIVSVLGIEAGSLFHVGAAALGLSALLMSSAVAFSLVKYVGALYLIYLGVRRLLEKNGEETRRASAPEPPSKLQVFGQGVLVNVFNPKTALFFFAFLPQFVDPSRGQVGLQIVLLGLIFVALATCTDSFYALAAGSARNWLKGNARFFHAQRYGTGSVYIALGIGTAVSGSHSR